MARNFGQPEKASPKPVVIVAEDGSGSYRTVTLAELASGNTGASTPSLNVLSHGHWRLLPWRLGQPHQGR